MVDQRAAAAHRRTLLVVATVIAAGAAAVGVAFGVSARLKRSGNGTFTASDGASSPAAAADASPPLPPPPPPSEEIGTSPTDDNDGTVQQGGELSPPTPTSRPAPDATPSTPGAPPTRRPNTTPAPTPTLEPMTCLDTTFACRTDRVGHDQPLARGQAICSRKDLFVFGLTHDDGSLIWMDCTTGDTRTYYDGGGGDVGHSFFVMKPDATLVVSDGDGNVLWERAVPGGETVTVYYGCLRDPYYDCPYLHLHKNRGNVVLNRIKNGVGWLSDNIDRLYDF